MSDPDGATPLTDSERLGLRQPVQTRDELNSAEAVNIGIAVGWLNSKHSAPEAVADETWLKELHRRDAEADARAWIGDTSKTRMSADEIAVRFGWRLVAIHPFPNGNGRWSRLVSDRMFIALGGDRFTWGGVSLISPGAIRRAYIDALQIADVNGDLRPLVAFARS
jgi:fido (protein-threonine AMPylation protein)